MMHFLAFFITTAVLVMFLGSRQQRMSDRYGIATMVKEHAIKTGLEPTRSIARPHSGETTIRSQRLVVDRDSGDLDATGATRATLALESGAEGLHRAFEVVILVMLVASERVRVPMNTILNKLNIGTRFWWKRWRGGEGTYAKDESHCTAR